MESTQEQEHVYDGKDYTYKRLKKSDLQKFHKQMPLANETQAIAEAIKALKPDEMGNFTIKKGSKTKAGTIKMRILRAAKAVGKKVVVKRFGDDVVYWVEEEPKETEPKEKTKGKK